MEILKEFGFDPVMLVAQIVNFLIIFYLLKRFLYKPVLGMLQKRKDIAAEGLRQAEESRLALEKTLEEEKKILTKAQDEAKKIIEESKAQATEVARTIEENTKHQAERILTEAKEQIDQESKETERKLSEKVSLLAEAMLTKSLEGFFGEKEQKQIVTKAVKQIKK
jgi:F-type H+-transporting ATPase subunit b